MKLNTFKVTLLTASIIAANSGVISAQELRELATTVVETANERSVSHTITVLGADEISNMSINNIEDSTRYIPGIQVNDSGNRFGDNGFNIRGLEGNAVAVTVDGISLGDTIAPASFSAYGMYDSNRGQVELEHVKSITITKGPSSVANGSNALAGSVAYTTNDASDFLINTGDDTMVRVKTGFDSRSDESMVNLTFANRTGGLESLLQYTIRDGDETEAHGDGLNVTGSAREIADSFSREVESVLAKVSYEFTEGQRMGVLYDRTERETEGTPLSRNSGTYFDFETDDENNKERYGLFYSWENAGLAAFDKVSATLDTQELYTSGITSFAFSSGGLTYLRREDRNTTQDSISFNFDFEKFIDGGVSHTLVYGFKWERREIDNVLFDRRFNGLTDDTGSRSGYPIRDPSWVPVTETDIMNLYISDAMQLTDQFRLSVGLRYDTTEYSPKVNNSFEDVSGSSVVDSEFDALAGEIIAEYEFFPGHSFLASYSQGYKAPSAQELYLDTNGSSVLVDIGTGIEYIDLDTVANQDLEAEEAASFEMGYKLELERTSLTITGYWTEYENLIQNVDLNLPYGTSVDYMSCGRFGCSILSQTVDAYKQAQNVGRVDVQGVEIDFTYLITDNLYTHFTYATIDGEYKDTLAGDPAFGEPAYNKGDKLETAAPDSATLSLGYQTDNGQWGVALHTVWFDAVEESSDNSFRQLNNGAGPAYYPDSYTIFDLTAYYGVTENLSLSAAAYNLTDKEYYRWEVVNSVRNGSGGFFGGVSDAGYKRYSEPGRSFSLNLAYSF